MYGFIMRSQRYCFFFTCRFLHALVFLAFVSESEWDATTFLIGQFASKTTCMLVIECYTSNKDCKCHETSEIDRSVCELHSCIYAYNKIKLMRSRSILIFQFFIRFNHFCDKVTEKFLIKNFTIERLSQIFITFILKSK